MRKNLTKLLVFLVSISNVIIYLPKIIQSTHAERIHAVESKEETEIMQNSENDKLTEFVDFYQEVEEAEDLPSKDGVQEVPSLEEKSETLPSDNETEAGETTNEMEKNTGSGLIRDLFPDPIVAEEVADWFNRTVNDIVSIESDLKPFIGTGNNHYIEMGDMGIQSVEGLQYFESIRGLLLEGNQLTDIAPLAQFKSLTVLDLSRNNITDMRPIESLIVNGLIVTASEQKIELPAITIGENYPINLVDYLGNNLLIDWKNPGNITSGNLSWGHSGLNQMIFTNNEDSGIVFSGTVSQEILDANPLISEIFPDPNLAQAVAEFFARTVNDEISIVHELNAQVGSIVFSNRKISQLDGMEHFTGVNSIDFRNNQISDISLLTSNLSNLVTLNVESNKIIELPNEINLPRLIFLFLDNNEIEDIKPLVNLSMLQTLALNSNKIADISPVNELTRLRDVRLSNNMVENISPLSELNQIASLALRANKIVDISPLSNLMSLRTVRLDNNIIEDVSYLSELNNLVLLELNGNQISDISPLPKLLTTSRITATNQRITLDPVLLGSDNPFTLATLDGIPMQTDFRTEGALVENQLSWVNSGPNNFTFNGSGETENGQSVTFSGTVTQEVVLDFGLTAVPERFEFGKSNRISPSLSQIQADSTEVVTVEDNRPDQLGWRLQVRMAELTSSTNNRLTGTTMSIKTSFTETAEGEVPHLFDTLTINNANRQLVSANPGEGTGKWSIGFDQLTLNVPGSVAITGESYTGNVTWTLLNTP